MMMAGGLRARLATLAILLVVFGAGLAVGVAVDRQVAAAADAPASVAGTSSADEPERDREERRRRGPMVEKVGLDQDQKVQVDSIFRAWGGRMSSLQKEYREHYWAVVDSTRAAMRTVLTPEQAMAYDSLVAENDRRRRPDSVSLPRN
jgi:Spy/CpxP family protein refolding chaperone